MNWFKKSDDDESAKFYLEAEIKAALEEIAIEHADTEKYGKIADNVETLCRAWNDLNETDKAKQKLDVNVLIPVIGSLATVLLILNYEKIDAVTTKALAFVVKPKI